MSLPPTRVEAPAMHTGGGDNGSEGPEAERAEPAWDAREEWGLLGVEPALEGGLGSGRELRLNEGDVAPVGSVALPELWLGATMRVV